MTGTALEMRFVADLDELERTIGDLSRCDRALGDLLEEVEDRVSALHLTWAGAAADAHAEAERSWRAGYHEMTEALASIRTAARAAHDNYDAAARANAAMWGRVR